MNASSQTSPVALALLTGSPVPYKIPLYRMLHGDPRVDFTVIFASSAGIRPYDDDSFVRGVAWDLDMTEGYRGHFLKRADTSPPLGRYFWSVRDADVVQALLGRRPDVLWLDGYNSATYLMGIVTQRILGGRVVFREEQTMLHPRSFAKTIAKEAMLRALFRGHHAMYIGTENRRWFEHYGVPRDRLFSAPYSVDNDFFRREAERLLPHKQELRREFGVSDDEGPIVLTVCRLVPKKQPLFTLEVFRRVRAERRCSLIIAGSGPLEAQMRHEVEARRIPNVHFAGFMNQTEVSRAYASADIFTLLSREHETFGVVVAEAMNFGLPVVVSDRVGCAADLVSRDFNGHITPFDDVQAAAESLAHLVDHPARRQSMGLGSAQRIKQWGVERTAAGVLAATAAAVGRERWNRASAGIAGPCDHSFEPMSL